jgi:hypothetical protein
MGKLSDDEIRQIVQKASLLEKFGEEGSSKKQSDSNDEIDSLYKITDDIGIPRRFVYEAYIERAGIPVHEPLVIDNNDFNSTEVVGFAKGSLDKELFNELKGQVEYYFNTLGTVTRRRNKTIWKAKPVGPSKLIASSNSPEVEFEQVDGSTKIKVSQSLKTLNKLYLPSIAAALGGFMMYAAVIFERAGNDAAPMLIISTLILTGAFLYTRFVNSRKKKRKKNLQELVETLQGKIERHLKSTIDKSVDEKNSAQIEIPENEYHEEDVDMKSRSKINE